VPCEGEEGGGGGEKRIGSSATSALAKASRKRRWPEKLQTGRKEGRGATASTPSRFHDELDEVVGQQCRRKGEGGRSPLASLNVPSIDLLEKRGKRGGRRPGADCRPRILSSSSSERKGGKKGKGHLENLSPLTNAERERKVLRADHAYYLFIFFSSNKGEKGGGGPR